MGRRVATASGAHGLAQLAREVAACTACARLVAWREKAAQDKRAAYATETYWGRGVPGFGDAQARVVLLGLAPAAHGANRTGRMFTGDRSGDFLYAALHRAGLCNQPHSTHRKDGLALHGCYITAAARCAPPDNKPLPEELEACSVHLNREMLLLTRAVVVVALGKVAWDAYLRWAARTQAVVLRPRPAFGHAAACTTGLPHALLGSYHPSQQNTFTGRLTPEMLDAVLQQACRLALHQ